MARQQTQTQDAAQNETPQNETPKVDVSDIPEDRAADTTLATSIENAAKLLEQKKELLSKIQGARTLTTLLVEQGIGSREQVEWVRTYLPRKSRSAKGEDNGAEVAADA